MEIEFGRDKQSGGPESASELRAFLEEIGEHQLNFARLLAKWGDDRAPATILRSVQRMASGNTLIPGTMRVAMAVLRERQAVDQIVQGFAKRPSGG